MLGIDAGTSEDRAFWLAFFALTNQPDRDINPSLFSRMPESRLDWHRALCNCSFLLRRLHVAEHEEQRYVVDDL